MTNTNIVMIIDEIAFNSLSQKRDKKKKRKEISHNNSGLVPYEERIQSKPGSKVFISPQLLCNLTVGGKNHDLVVQIMSLCFTGIFSMIWVKIQ
jgi:hypothetical protein